MTAEDYWEAGASGRRYSRQLVLDGLEKRFSFPTPTFGRRAIFTAADYRRIPIC